MFRLKNQIDLHVSKIQEVREVMAGSQPDQTLINERILSQLDAIGKDSTAIKESSAPAAQSKGRKATVRGTSSSSFNGSFTEGD